MTDAVTKCPGCGVALPATKGATHDYMLSSPACWEAYGQVLAREYENPALFAAAHRFSVDAYALQHPGDVADRRAVQSVRIHYVSLHLIFEHDFDHRAATAALKTLAGRSFEPLPEPSAPFDKTIIHTLDATSETHPARAREWALSAYNSWFYLKPFAEEMYSLIASTKA